MAMAFNIDSLLRDNIKKLTPYSSARDEFQGEASILLDANENAFGSPLPTNYNRYPDPLQGKLKAKISQIKGVPAENIFLGNGSDEAIDLLFRAFCRPGIDNILIVPPTYGMYEVSANIHDVGIKRVPLTPEFQLDLDGIAEAIDENTKLIFICSPNNPTGNSIHRQDIETVLHHFSGLVVVDEAYINFARQKSLTQELAEYQNLVVLQTLSKAWGLAGLRIGMAFADRQIIAIFNKVKAPYNINEVSQELALQALEEVDKINAWIQILVSERDRLAAELLRVPQVAYVYPSDANFLLVKVSDPKGLYKYLVDQGIIIRDRSSVTLCEGCVRITIGTPEENQELLQAFHAYAGSKLR